MALSALWNRLGRWTSAMSQLLQPFMSPQTSCTKGSANISQQPGQHQQPLSAPSASPAGTRTFLPPPAPLASTHGTAPPSNTAVGVPRARRKPLAPAPPVRRQSQQRPARAAKPSGTPVASGSPRHKTTPMDWDTTPSINISVASDVPMDEDSRSRRCDISLATDVPMEDEDTHHCDISLATDVPMEEETTQRCDISVATDIPMDEDTVPRAGTSLYIPITASQSRAHHVHAIRGSVVTPAMKTVLQKKGLLKGSLKGFSCSKRAVGTSHHNRSSVPTPMAQAGTSGTSPQHNTTSLGCTSKMPPAHCSVPTTSKALQSTGHCNASSMKSRDPQQHAGTHLPPAQSSMSPQAMGLQRQGRKRKMDSGPGLVSNAKCPTLTAGAQRWH